MFLCLGCVWSNLFEPVYLEADEFCHFRIECESLSWQQPEFLVILSGYGDDQSVRPPLGWMWSFSSDKVIVGLLGGTGRHAALSRIG